MSRLRLLASVAVCAPFCFPAIAFPAMASAQKATDSSVQASPIRPVPEAPVVDSSAQASPVPHVHTRSRLRVAPHIALHLRLSRSIDSGRLKNGQTVHATLIRPVALTPRGSLPAGTPVDLTVITTLPAGRISSVGEFSLQVLRIGSSPVYTNTLTFHGKPGHKDQPYSAPSVGTDARLHAGTTLIFHVQPMP